MFKSIYRLILLLLSFVLLSVFISYSPEDIGFGGVLVVFVLMYFWFFSLFAVIFELFKIDFNNILLVVLAFLPTSVIALTSLDQLSGRDMLLLISLQAIAVFYWVRRRKH